MITQETKQMLHESIDAAKGFNECVYVKDGQPQCVVAQVAVRCGVTVEEMDSWRTSYGKPEAFFRVPSEHNLPEAMDNITWVLYELQKYWDNLRTDGAGSYLPSIPDEQTARKLMHEYVDRL